jgi:hypothetical protein
VVATSNLKNVTTIRFCHALTPGSQPVKLTSRFVLAARTFVISLQDCVNKTIARIKSKLEKDDKRVLNHVVYGLRSTRK